MRKELHTCRAPDGSALATLVLRAADVTGPVILIRTPYGKEGVLTPRPSVGVPVADLLEQGVSVVVQDCRGTGASDGSFFPFVNEMADGLAALEWVRRQPWCNGMVGMVGASYLGFTQLEIAAAGTEKLTCIVPINTTADYFAGWIYSQSGALSFENTLRFAYAMAVAEARRAGDEAAALELSAVASKADTYLWDEHPGAHDILLRHAPWYAELRRRATDKAFWDEANTLHNLRHAATPALHIGGWYDYFSDSTFDIYEAMQAASNEGAAGNQYLVVGPWDHLSFSGTFPSQDFAPSGSGEAFGLDEFRARFLRRFLFEDAEVEIGAHVNLFVMGSNRWLHADRWPLPGAESATFHLTSQFTLDPLRPAHTDLTCHPLNLDRGNPVLTQGGRMLTNGGFWSAAGPAPQASHPDLLTYRSAPLEQPLHVIGRIGLHLEALADAPYHITARLIDEAPDGKASILTEGIALLSSADEAADMNLSVTANTFAVGHRLRLDVSASSFPRYELQSGPSNRVACAQLLPNRCRLSLMTHPWPWREAHAASESSPEVRKRLLDTIGGMAGLEPYDVDDITKPHER